MAHLCGTEPPQRGRTPLWWYVPTTKEAVMNESHFDRQAQRESTCSLVHGTWRCVGAKIACAGACALMVGQLLLPSVALATECADPAAGTDEVAAAPGRRRLRRMRPQRPHQPLRPRLQPMLLRRRKPPLSLSRRPRLAPPMNPTMRHPLNKILPATTPPRRRMTPSCPVA